MKSWLKYTLAIILMFVFTGVGAQIKSTYTGGLHISTMTLKAEGLNSSPTTPLGIHFGYVFEIPVIRGFTFKPGILFSAKGTDYKIDSTDHSISPIYIEIPANIAFTFGTDMVRISLYSGPYIAFGVGGTIWESEQSVKDLKFGRGAGKDIRFIDAGLNFGIGVCIKKFLVTVHYGMGLVNVSSDKSRISEMKNRVTGISFSTAFVNRK
jgi:hypothetical protein